MLTTSGTASSLLTDSTGAAYVTVGGSRMGRQRCDERIHRPLVDGRQLHRQHRHTAFSGNADVLGNVNLSGSSTVSTLRFNSGSQTVSGGTLTTGGILDDRQQRSLGDQRRHAEGYRRRQSDDYSE